MVIGIIGGGPSGMTAALFASQNPQVQVVLLERQARVGRKLLATGNGRCNLSNLHALERGYHGENPAFARPALEAFPPEALRSWLSLLGLYTVAEPSGRVYPYSDQANSVVDILRFALDRPNLEVRTGVEVTDIAWQGNGFSLEVGGQSMTFDRLVVACGGAAGAKLGGTMAGYQLLRTLGHSVIRLRPSLVQLRTSWSGIGALKGVRANCHGEITRDGTFFSGSTGEIQFTDYGLSGPVIFEISRDVCQTPGKWVCTLDFLPDVSADGLHAMLASRKHLPPGALFTGLLQNRLGKVIAKEAGIGEQQRLDALTPAQLQQAVNLAKAFPVALTRPMGMDCAQVTAGGADTAGFDPQTLESRLIPGLFACGEVLDIDGDCGGYNLQWAFSSGRLAGLSAGRSRQ